MGTEVKRGDAAFESGRLLPFELAEGASNMAVDQALAESAADQVTLRFYGWSIATLSLGYFQSLAERQQHVESSRLPLVRHSTGGGAIVHDRELTYCLVVPSRELAKFRVATGHLTSVPASTGAALFLYDVVHAAVIQALKQFGVHAELFGERVKSVTEIEPFLCFERRTAWDVVSSGYKILGSAQRRLRGAVLQHGSVLLSASSAAPQLPGVCDLSSSKITPLELQHALETELSNSLRVQWHTSCLTQIERQSAEMICESRFNDPNWTTRRR